VVSIKLFHDGPMADVFLNTTLNLGFVTECSNFLRRTLYHVDSEMTVWEERTSHFGITNQKPIKMLLVCTGDG
jgi:hypothetical protein